MMGALSGISLPDSLNQVRLIIASPCLTAPHCTHLAWCCHGNQVGLNVGVMGGGAPQLGGPNFGGQMPSQMPPGGPMPGAMGIGGPPAGPMGPAQMGLQMPMSSFEHAFDHTGAPGVAHGAGATPKGPAQPGECGQMPSSGGAEPLAAGAFASLLGAPPPPGGAMPQVAAQNGAASNGTNPCAALFSLPGAIPGGLPSPGSQATGGIGLGLGTALSPSQHGGVGGLVSGEGQSSPGGRRQDSHNAFTLCLCICGCTLLTVISLRVQVGGRLLPLGPTALGLSPA